MLFSKTRYLTGTIQWKHKKGVEGVSIYPFLFLEKKVTKRKFGNAYSEKPQVALSGTKHTITTSDNEILQHNTSLKLIFTTKARERRSGLRGKDARFMKSPKVEQLYRVRKQLRRSRAYNSTRGHHESHWWSHRADPVTNRYKKERIIRERTAKGWSEAARAPTTLWVHQHNRTSLKTPLAY